MDTLDKMIIALVAFIIGLLLVAFFISPIFELRNYERVTGEQVGYWDAFFVELDPSHHNLQLEDKD